ncbi:MAG TPA: hypothetical protein VF520_05480 [Thermoleophilaceae bacterium]|jgi:hypothetical protein
MRPPSRRLLPSFGLVLAAVALACAAVALAAPPANDDRANPQAIEVGDRVGGTTTDATREETEPASGCSTAGGSVWYRLDATRDARVIAALQAEGDLDAVVDVYRRERSQLRFLSCDVSDRRGQAAVGFRIEKGESYMISVSQLANSQPGDFTLEVGLASPPARPPGRPLPSKGASGTVQRVFQPSDAWSMRLREGRTYKINLAGSGCMGLAVYPPGTSDFEDDSPVRTAGCDGYLVFTPGPGQGGRYSFLVSASFASRGRQAYHLQAAPAGRDDTTPGRFIRNHVRVTGRVNARKVDVVDLYRFDVVKRSITELSLGSRSGDDLDLILLGESGKRIKCACGGESDEALRLRTRPGRYYVAVVAGDGSKGAYTLSRASKLITNTRLTANGSRSTDLSPGQSARLGVGVSPGASGPVEILVERFDPLEGYQFLRRFRLTARGGRTGVTFRPPSEGRYRARARFLGTRNASASKSGLARFHVKSPLRD